MMLTIIVMIADNTNAQTRKIKKNSFNKNYSVCQNLAGNYICSSDQLRAQNQRRQVVAAPGAIETEVIAMPSTTVLNDKPTNPYNNYYRYHNFIIGDDMTNPANGDPSQQYDGPAKNAERNMNYNQNQLTLRASDGSK